MHDNSTYNMGGVCCCSLANTEACLACSNRRSAWDDGYYNHIPYIQPKKDIKIIIEIK